MTITSAWRAQGEEYSAMSALDGSLLRRGVMLSREQLQSLADTPASGPFSHDGMPAAFLGRLAAELDRRREALIRAMRHETGFIPSDCDEVFSGVLTMLGGYSANAGLLAKDPPNAYDNCGRTMRLTSAPWGTIAVILPQNAFLYLAVTCLVNALAAGNRVVLRAPGQSALSADLLASALRDAGVETNHAAVVMAKSKEFVGAFQESAQPCLIHYMGGSRHAPQILSDSFMAGKASLIDGDGNVLVYVGPEADPSDTAAMLTQGAVRYNGQTCTSINGAVIHPKLYEHVRAALIRRWRALTFGDTITDPDVSVGPLLSADQALGCRRQLAQSGGTLIAGGRSLGNILEPALLESPEPNSGLAREGLFGPALWIASGDAEEFVQIWRSNRYPLCAGVVHAAEPLGWWLSRLPGVARLVVDGDPSIEDIFEPWGGYLGSGSNPVGDWKSKYRRVVQVDAPA